jgi:hypothetical protein
MRNSAASATIAAPVYFCGAGVAQLLDLVEDHRARGAGEVVAPAGDLRVGDDQHVGVLAAHLARFLTGRTAQPRDDVAAQHREAQAELAQPLALQVRRADDDRGQRARVAEHEQAGERLAEPEVVDQQQPADAEDDVGGDELVVARLARGRVPPSNVSRSPERTRSTASCASTYSVVRPSRRARARRPSSAASAP